jgi:hypothetical protein
MPFDRALLPEPATYFEGEGLTLTGPRSAKWKTTACTFHGGSDSMRVNTTTGAWVCMAGCGARGGDVLAYQMAAHAMDFIEAAQALGAWVDDGKPHIQQRPTPLSPRAALQVLAFESTLTAIAAGNLARGVALNDVDLQRLLVAVSRITRLVESYS